MPDRSHPLELLRQAADGRASAGLRRVLTPRGPGHDGLLDLASNDYLGLCGDERLTEGAVEAVRKWGPGSTGSRLVTGTTELHAELEAQLAQFTGAQAALVFSSGYLANLTVITALVTALSGPAGVLVVSDARNHASLIDACRLSRARVVVTPHRDARAVRRGLAAAAGIAAEPDLIRTVTLSKSLAGQGGAVLGAADVIGTLVDIGRGFIFDTGLAPPCAGAALAALQVIAAEPALGARAQASAARLAAIATQAGLRTAPSGAAVLAVVVGESGQAVQAQRTCARHGVRAGCFRPPSVPAGQACLRLTGRANLAEGDFEVAARALAAARDHDGS